MSHLARLYLRLCNAWLRGFTRALDLARYSTEYKTEVRRVVVFRKAGIGDGITSLPALEVIAMAFPQADKILLTLENEAHQPGIGEILELEGHPDWKVIAVTDPLDANCYKGSLEGTLDLFIDLPIYRSSVRYEMRVIRLAKRLGARYATGFEVSSIEKLAKYQTGLFPFAYDGDRLEALIVRSLTGAEPQGNTDKETNTEAHTIDKTIGMFVLGAGFALKYWPVEYWNALRSLLATEKVVWVMGARDYAHYQNGLQIAEGDEILVDAALADVMNNVLKCSWVVAHDTGLLHLAARLQKRTVGIYPARNMPGMWEPRNASTKVLRDDSVSCRQCYLMECSHQTCLRNICPTKVAEALKELVASPANGAAGDRKAWT